METMSRGGANLPTSLSGGGLAHISAEVTLLHTSINSLLIIMILKASQTFMLMLFVLCTNLISF